MHECHFAAFTLHMVYTTHGLDHHNLLFVMFLNLKLMCSDLNEPLKRFPFFHQLVMIGQMTHVVLVKVFQRMIAPFVNNQQQLQKIILWY